MQSKMRSPFLFLMLTGIPALMVGCMNEPPTPIAMDSFGSTLETLEPLVAAAIPEPSLEDKAQAGALRVEGLTLRGQGNLEGAIAALQQSVMLDPTHLEGYVILGWTQHLNQQRQEAESTLKRAIALDDAHIPALNALGIVYLVEGQLDQAVQTHTQALELNPRNEIAAYNLSLAYQRLERHDDAIDHALLATELEPYNPHPWVALAIAHDSAGETAAADTAYRQAWNLDRRYGDRGYLGHLEQAGFSPGQIQLTEAILSRL
jgi:Flp pilus assembly protein TadD